jgi:Gas vesicle synthesis protein GvpO
VTKADEDEDRQEDVENEEVSTEEEEEEEEDRSRGRSNHRLTGREAVREARQQLFELIGRPVEQVLSMERDDDGDWQVLVQVVELERIPNSTDVLGAYRVTLDDDGEVVGYRRIRRYVRSQADED